MHPRGANLDLEFTCERHDKLFAKCLEIRHALCNSEWLRQVKVRKELGMATPVNQLPAADPESGRLNVVVDTPKGSRNNWTSGTASGD